jgi:hypothetical protein
VKKIGLFLVIALFLSVMAPVNATLAQAPEEMVNVLVTYYQPPGPNDVALVQGFNGAVEKVYHVVPTILARMPSKHIQQLSKNPRVRIIEEDVVRENYLLEEVLPWGGRAFTDMHYVYPETPKDGKIGLDIYKEGEPAPIEQSTYYVKFD